VMYFGSSEACDEVVAQGSLVNLIAQPCDPRVEPRLIFVDSSTENSIVCLGEIGKAKKSLGWFIHSRQKCFWSLLSRTLLHAKLHARLVPYFIDSWPQFAPSYQLQNALAMPIPAPWYLNMPPNSLKKSRKHILIH
jgi:hypothetical protein